MDDFFNEDLFDEDQNLKNDEIKLEEWIFPIIGRSCGETNTVSLGTGFFINNEGYFVTAGHVLKKIEQIYKAVIDDNEYDFELIFIEYMIKESQNPPICKDLAICKLKNKIKKEISYVLDSNFSSGKILTLDGFSKQNYPGRATIGAQRTNQHFYRWVATAQDIKKQDPGEIKNTDIDKRPYCKNTRSLVVKRELNGLSGGPVYDNTSIYGMLISNEYILSEYIIEKLDQLKIPFNKIE